MRVPSRPGITRYLVDIRSDLKNHARCWDSFHISMAYPCKCAAVAEIVKNMAKIWREVTYRSRDTFRQTRDNPSRTLFWLGSKEGERGHCERRNTIPLAGMRAGFRFRWTEPGWIRWRPRGLNLSCPWTLMLAPTHKICLGLHAVAPNRLSKLFGIRIGVDNSRVWNNTSTAFRKRTWLSVGQKDWMMNW